MPFSSLEFTEVKLSTGALCRIPIFVSDACARIMDQIEVEGIFRKAGSQIRQREIRVSRFNYIGHGDTAKD